MNVRDDSESDCSIDSTTGKYTLIVTQDGTGHIYSLSGIKWVGGTVNEKPKPYDRDAAG